MSDQIAHHPQQGAVVEVPTVCPLCASWVGSSFDVHAVLVHPETRPAMAAMRAHREEMATVKKTKKRR